jgi:hypothetical protein
MVGSSDETYRDLMGSPIGRPGIARAAYALTDTLILKVLRVRHSDQSEKEVAAWERLRRSNSPHVHLFASIYAASASGNRAWMVMERADSFTEYNATSGPHIRTLYSLGVTDLHSGNVGWFASLRCFKVTDYGFSSVNIRGTARTSDARPGRAGWASSDHDNDTCGDRGCSACHPRSSCGGCGECDQCYVHPTTCCDHCGGPRSCDETACVISANEVYCDARPNQRCAAQLVGMVRLGIFSDRIFLCANHMPYDPPTTEQIIGANVVWCGHADGTHGTCAGQLVGARMVNGERIFYCGKHLPVSPEPTSGPVVALGSWARPTPVWARSLPIVPVPTPWSARMRRQRWLNGGHWTGPNASLLNG